MDTAVVVGNPKPASRTLSAATMVAECISGEPPGLVIDAVSLGAGLVGFGDLETANAVKSVQGAQLVVFASPTYKASLTGILKCFLDQFPGGGLEGIIAVPLMLGAGPGHTLAPELTLKPVLVELGAICPTRAIYLLDSSFEDKAALQPWLSTALPILKPYLER